MMRNDTLDRFCHYMSMSESQTCMQSRNPPNVAVSLPWLVSNIIINPLVDFIFAETIGWGMTLPFYFFRCTMSFVF